MLLQEELLTAAGGSNQHGQQPGSQPEPHAAWRHADWQCDEVSCVVCYMPAHVAAGKEQQHGQRKVAGGYAGVHRVCDPAVAALQARIKTAVHHVVRCSVCPAPAQVVPNKKIRSVLCRLRAAEQEVRVLPK
jgi:hypothetical protein